MLSSRKQMEFFVLRHCIVLLAFGVLLSSCASQPKQEGPDWMHQPTRTVDNGYIVYVGSGQSRDTLKAQFKAEGMALEDLANECSFIPKGARLEDRFVQQGTNEHVAYVKIAVEFQECAQSQKTLEPSEITKLANVSFTEQLRRYQDLEETGELPQKSEYAALEMPAEVPPPPVASAGMSPAVHFTVMRQYVAYQKETVILASPTAYPINSPQASHFVSAIQPAVGQIHQIGAQNPSFEKNPQPWSKVTDRPRALRPAALAPAHHNSGYKNALPYIKQSDQMKKEAKKKKGSRKHGKNKRIEQQN